ncbi:MAG TPA: SRPBCC family protein [Candidatus Woesearchaeota archaeon]|jgi:hypothetical protein|nr:SRPBCC family protein [Candidatus Woesearchaeota archaeon]HJN57128.1 SRPBCC family protein [Candidatus Woesearchaeota archaeon]|tara:strand:+ start:38510 stop:38953 length:444 start_codon:yes stop_codon:yes gene_type:complete
MKMMVKKDIIINAPIKKVWHVFSDLEKWQGWSSNIAKASWITSDKWDLNSSFRQILTGVLPFKNVESNARVIEIEDYRKVTWTGMRKTIRGIHTFRFEKIGNKTKVENIEEFKGPLAPIMFPLLKHRFEAFFVRFLKEMKEEVEGLE